MEDQGSKWVVLVPAPFQGHLTPLLELGSVLHSRGFSINIVADPKFSSPISSNHPDFVFLPISENSSGHDVVITNPFAAIQILNSNCKTPLLECLARLMEEQKPNDKVSCVIYDFLLYCADEVANHLKLPSIIFRTSSASSGLAYSKLPRLHAQGVIPVQDSMLQELVPECYPLRFKDLPGAKSATLDDVLNYVATVVSRRSSSSAMILNTMDHLDQPALAELQQRYQIPFFPVGPLHKIAPSPSTSVLKEDDCCISWLNNQAPNSVIYISLGSIVSVDEKALAEMAWGLANSNQKFLWVIRPGSICGSKWTELLPEGFMERIEGRGSIVKWAPQKEVLAHKAVGGFWSHCGWNSTMESICEGVPMICWPSFGDQKVNARYLSHVWGVGLELEGELERGEIERALRRLMVEKEGMEIRQRAIGLKDTAEVAMRKGGSSWNSQDALVDLILIHGNGRGMI